MEEYLDTKGAAQFLKCSEVALKKARKTGILWETGAPRFMKIGRNVRYKESVLREWIEIADSDCYVDFESKGARLKIRKVGE